MSIPPPLGDGGEDKSTLCKCMFAPKSQLSKYTNWAEIIRLQEQGIKWE